MADLMNPIINPVRNAMLRTWSAPHCRVTRSPIALGTSPHRQYVQCSICSICSASKRSWIVGSIIIVALVAVGERQHRALARLVHADEPSNLFARLGIAHFLFLEYASAYPFCQQSIDPHDIGLALLRFRVADVQFQALGNDIAEPTIGL